LYKDQIKLGLSSSFWYKKTFLRRGVDIIRMNMEVFSITFVDNKIQMSMELICIRSGEFQLR
jgi:hypothetical protein